MMDKAARLLRHPGFRAAPLRVLTRGVALAWHLRRGAVPAFPVMRGGPLLLVPPDWRYTTLSAFLMREHVEPELAALERFVPPGGVLVDVGANIGLFSLKGAHLVGPAGLVLAVEPGAVSIARLEANIALNHLPQLRLVRAALSDSEGEMTLYHVPLGDDPQAFSLLSDGSAMASETVAVTTLDHLARAQALSRLDCIKIDVEGAEPMVVAGGRATLARFRPIIIFEVNAPMAGGQDNPAACFDALMAMGYGISRLDGDALTPLGQQPAVHGNLIAIHPQGPQPR